MTGAIWMGLALVGYAADDEGPIGQVGQPLVGGDLVDTATQRRVGLVTVNGGCSGTLINQYWVLTALHCVSQGNKLGGALDSPTNITVSASWSPKMPVATKLVSFVDDGLNVALVFLGAGDFGAVDRQLFFVEEVDTTLLVRKYGRGISEFAKSGPPPVPAVGDGRYRTGLFTPTSADARGYSFPMNGRGQMADGGDSGGADFVEYGGISLGISGVQSTCRATGFVDGKPRNWDWATGIDLCSSAALGTIRDEILAVSAEVPGGQVFVGLSTGTSFASGQQWGSEFCTRDETCAMGDVNGDGRDDAIRFVKTDHSARDSDVWVALSDGRRFLPAQKWHDAFCTLGETCEVADVNGDGRADVVSFVKTNHGANDSDVWVALSTGSGFGPGQKWADYFCTLAETCAVGDVNGDGRANLLSFVRTNNGNGDSDVWVALSTGSGFAAGQKWHDYFCTLSETCAVGDVNADGKADILSFVKTNHGNGDSDVWVALSTGSGFGAGQKWADYFCTLDETCVVGDVNGDGRDDALSFVRTNNGNGDSDVWVGPSTGTGFAGGEKWHDFFCTLDETCAVGDVDGDGRDDAIAFVRGD